MLPSQSHDSWEQRHPRPRTGTQVARSTRLQVSSTRPLLTRPRTVSSQQQRQLCGHPTTQQHQAPQQAANAHPRSPRHLATCATVRGLVLATCPCWLLGLATARAGPGAGYLGWAELAAAGYLDWLFRCLCGAWCWLLGLPGAGYLGWLLGRWLLDPAEAAKKPTQVASTRPPPQASK